MKKFFPFLLLAFFALTIISCDNDDDRDYTDNDTYSVVLDIKNESFTYDKDLGYVIHKSFTNPLYNSDVVLIYRQSGTDNGNPIWQQIPRTLYLNQGELDYDFDFTINDIAIYAGGNYDISTTPQFLNNQNFRVVLVPASFGRATSSAGNVDYSDYNSVIKYYNIDDSKVKSL